MHIFEFDLNPMIAVGGVGGFSARAVFHSYCHEPGIIGRTSLAMSKRFSVTNQVKPTIYVKFFREYEANG